MGCKPGTTGVSQGTRPRGYGPHMSKHQPGFRPVSLAILVGSFLSCGHWLCSDKPTGPAALFSKDGWMVTQGRT